MYNYELNKNEEVILISEKSLLKKEMKFPMLQPS